MNKLSLLREIEIDRVIEMAWEDRTPFEAIKMQYGLNEKDVIELMRAAMKPDSFRLWRTRMNGRVTKHQLKRGKNISRFKCSRQRSISLNKIAKR